MKCAWAAMIAIAMWSSSIVNAQGEEEIDAGSDASTPPAGVSGKFLVYEFARPDSIARACSFRYPTCVHAGAFVPREDVLSVLRSIEHAWDAGTIALDLLAPDPDLETRAYDVYLVAKDNVAVQSIDRASTALSARDVRSRIDRASAFTLLDASIVHEGDCALDMAVARQWLRASLFRSTPAIDEGSARAEVEHLALLMNACATFDARASKAFQDHPERTIIDAQSEVFDRGASLFFAWLDAKYADSPGAIVRAMWALAPTMTPIGAARWNDEPDGFDVLRKTFKDAINKGSTIDDLWVDFAASRPFFGTNDVDSVFPDALSLGESAPIREDWDVEWPAHPRRLASSIGTQPTGASYVLVHHDRASPNSKLRVEIEWEAYAKMKWTALKLDANHHEIARVGVTSMLRASEAQITLDDLDRTSEILFVGANTGDTTYAFDPDDAVWEPHGWMFTIAPE